MPLQLNLKEQDKVKVFFKTMGGGNRNEDFEVIEETNSLIRLKNSRGTKTIDKYDIICRKVKIEKIEENESEDNKMPKIEAKITKEQLLEECKIHGIDKEAEVIIGSKYGLSPLTIRNYINKWLSNKDKNDLRKTIKNTKNDDKCHSNEVNAPNKTITKTTSEIRNTIETAVIKAADKVLENADAVNKKVEQTLIKSENIKYGVLAAPFQEPNTLNAISMVLEGTNGRYNLSEKEIKLTKGNFSISFTEKEELNKFLSEFSKAFNTWERLIKKA